MPVPRPQPFPTFSDYSRRFIEAAEKELGESSDSAFVKNSLSYAEKLIEKGVPVIFDVEHFSALVGYTPRYVKGAAYCSEKHYRRFSIEKRSGGLREIAEPLPSLKDIQRWVYENVLLRISISSMAKAFVPKMTLRDSARFHKGQNFVLRVDIKDFFPSISRSRVFGIFRQLGYSSEVSGILARLCCYRDALPQGGVCSPYLSNVVLRGVDKRVSGFCRENGLRYTRYADDLTVSGAKFSPAFVRFIYRVIREEGFEVNEKKTVVMRSGSRQSVVGVVVNQGMNAPREFRRKLRQQAYFIGKYGLDDHLGRIGEMRSGATMHYLGKCSFALLLNPKDRDAASLRSRLIPPSDKIQ